MRNTVETMRYLLDDLLNNVFRKDAEILRDFSKYCAYAHLLSEHLDKLEAMLTEGGADDE